MFFYWVIANAFNNNPWIKSWSCSPSVRLRHSGITECRPTSVAVWKPIWTTGPSYTSSPGERVEPAMDVERYSTERSLWNTARHLNRIGNGMAPNRCSGPFLWIIGYDSMLRADLPRQRSLVQWQLSIGAEGVATGGGRTTLTREVAVIVKRIKR